MSDVMIEKLNEEIEKAQADLKAKKLMLQLVKKQQNKKYFIETAFGRLCLKAVALTTRPAADVYCEAQEALDTPRAFIAKQLVVTGDRLVTKARKVENNSTKKAWKLALEMADLKCELEEFITYEDVQLVLSALKNEVERLRPARDPETQKKIQDVVDGAMASMASSLAAGVSDGVQVA